MVWSLEPLQISSGRVLNGRILFLKSSKAGGLNFGAGGPYGPVQIRDIREFRLYGRPRLMASILDIVRPDAYSAERDSRRLGRTDGAWEYQGRLRFKATELERFARINIRVNIGVRLRSPQSARRASRSTSGSDRLIYNRNWEWINSYCTADRRLYASHKSRDVQSRLEST